jgi:hypothetical protein
MPSDEQRAMIAELAAEIPFHLRRVETVASALPEPARDALRRYAAAGAQAILEIERERLGVKRG